MRRAVIATAGTVVGLVLLLGYRSEGAVKVDKVDAGAGTSSTSPGTNTTVGPGTNTGTNTGTRRPRRYRRRPLRAPTGPTRARMSPTVTATSRWRSPWTAAGSSPSRCRRTTRSPRTPKRSTRRRSPSSCGRLWLLRVSTSTSFPGPRTRATPSPSRCSLPSTKPANDGAMGGPGATGVVHHEEVMGTVVTFDVRTPAPQAQVDAALASATRWLHWVDDTFSTYKPNSEVNRFDRGELPIDECCEELKKVVALCYKFNGATGGFFDAWASGHFDPSGVVKGWSVEHASRLLQASRFAGPCDRRRGRRPPERGPGNGPALACRCPPPASTRGLLRRLVASWAGLLPPQAPTSGACT